MENLIDVSDLVTIRSFADKKKITPVWLRQLIKDKKVKGHVIIDGVHFLILTLAEQSYAQYEKAYNRAS